MKKSKESVHIRKRYIHHSRKMLEWVDNLGFEKTLFGQIAQTLEKKFRLRKISLLFLYCLILSFVMLLDLDYSQNVEVGDVAQSDIKSPMSFQIVDEVATEAKRAEVENSILPVFDYDPDALDVVNNRVYTAFRKMRSYARNTRWPLKEDQFEVAVKDFFKHKPEFEELLGIEFPNRQFEWLVERKFQVGVENIVIRALAKWSSYKLIDNPKRVLRPSDQQIIIRQIGSSGSGLEIAESLDKVRDLRDRQLFSLDGVRGTNRFSGKDLSNILKVAHSLLVPNITFNKQETSQRRKMARDSVLPVQISIQKNQTIVSAGSKIQPIHITIINEIKNLRSDKRKDFVSLISAFLFVTLVLVFFSYLRRFTQNKVRVDLRQLLVMGFVGLLIVSITKLFLFMTDAAFVVKYGDLIPPTFFLFAAPVAAGPMLVGLLITSGEVVWLFTCFMAAVLGVMVDFNFTLFLLAVGGGIAAARGVYGCEKRNDIYIAGLRTGVINAIIIACCITIEHLSTGQLVHLLAWGVPAGLLGGVLSSMVSMMIVPLLESSFNFTTDIKLLELSNLNHPLMKQMMVKAPGTYHHSLAVGTMVEEAATKIGCNPMLAKVMAYYHDIGKMEHAQYFVENQRPGYNPHDHITPYMSKTILIAHVKDGAEMGLQYKLGRPIIDGVLQHHGTTLISYFYNKAMAEQDEDIDTVEESDFRYPGPKPQFKEAALVMLGDSIEAAARSMEEPTATRLTHLVKNIIQSKFIDGQLDECNLTLKELSIIEQAFKKTLLSIYHQRIDYPHMKLGAPVDNNQKSGKKGLQSVGNS